jgi:FtsP/CotA-like multicopper oxidase with cupredoxin domain
MAVTTVNLEARQLEWEFAPGRRIRGFGFNGGVPGPVIEVDAGGRIRARLTNDLAEPTTIHWHGLRVPADRDGTVNVPRKEQVRIAWLPDDRPGHWMYHCHILEHHAMGMMAHFEVVA